MAKTTRQIGVVIDGTTYCMACAESVIREYPDAKQTPVMESDGSAECYACNQTIR